MFVSLWITEKPGCFLPKFIPAFTEISDLSETDTNRQQTEFAERVRYAVKNGGGYSSVLEKSGFSGNSLNRYLKGHEMKVSTAVHLAEICGVNPQWLLFGEMNPHSDASKDIEGFHSEVGAGIPFYGDAEASAGYGLLGPDTPAPKQLTFSRSFLEELGLTPNHTIIIKVRGDSMEPTLKTGDRIFLNTKPSHNIGGVMVFVSSGQLLVKRLSPTASGTVKIIADNNRYLTEEVSIDRFRWGEPDGGDAITIIGRVAYRLQAMS